MSVHVHGLIDFEFRSDIAGMTYFSGECRYPIVQAGRTCARFGPLEMLLAYSRLAEKRSSMGLEPG